MEAYGPRNAEERTWRVIDAVGRWPTVEACRWHKSPSLGSGPPGGYLGDPRRPTVAQLGDNLGAADLRLSDEETGLLTEASTPHVSDYPYGRLGIDSAPAARLLAEASLRSSASARLCSVSSVIVGQIVRGPRRAPLLIEQTMG